VGWGGGVRARLTGGGRNGLLSGAHDQLPERNSCAIKPTAREKESSQTNGLKPIPRSRSVKEEKLRTNSGVRRGGSTPRHPASVEGRGRGGTGGTGAT